MGLLKFKQFSSVPDLFKRLAQRQQQRDQQFTQIAKDRNSFIVDNGIRRQASNEANNGTTVLFTVPVERVFFMVSAQLQITTLAANITSDAILQFNNSAGDFLGLSANNATAQSDSVSISPATPIKLEAGETIQVFSGAANLVATGSFVGYEIDEKLIQERL